MAQREDIYDPDVVHQFAAEVSSEMRLDYLYALTVADINATNPTLWNSWRATLLRHLYSETRKVLRRGLESSTDRAATIAAVQERALERLSDRLLERDILLQHRLIDIEDLWADLGDDFFLRHNPVQIARLTDTLLEHDVERGPFVSIDRTRGDAAGEGATQICIYASDQPQLFAATVVALNQQELSVVDATINTGTNGRCFDTYTVLSTTGDELFQDSARCRRVSQALTAAADDPSNMRPPSKRRLRRQLKQLPWPTEVSIELTPDGRASQLTVLASDRPGLLATIALLFVELELSILAAKITTLGERVEDRFLIQDQRGKPIAPGEASYTLANTIRQRLDRRLGVAQTTGQKAAG